MNSLPNVVALIKAISNPETDNFTLINQFISSILLYKVTYIVKKSTDFQKVIYLFPP